MWRKLSDVAFWIGISLYFGGIIAVGAVVAPSVFRTTDEAHISMPGIAAPPLTMSSQVGGEIFGDILSRFSYMEALSLALMLLGLSGWLLAHRHVRRSTWVVLILWAISAGLAAYDAASVRPAIWKLREAVRDGASTRAADAKDAPWPERSQFDKLHSWDETLNRFKGYTLLAMILVTAWRGLAEKHTAPPLDTRDIIKKTVKP
jgi:hypothetical protein